MKKRQAAEAGSNRLLLLIPGLIILLSVTVVSSASGNDVSDLTVSITEVQPALQGPTRSEVFRLNGPGIIQVSNLAGDITIRETDSDEVRIEMYEKRAFTFWGEHRKTEYRSIIVRNKNDISVNIEPGSGASVHRAKSGPEIMFIIYAPPYMEVNLKTGFGNIDVSGLGANHDIRTGAGNITLERSSGEGRVLTSAGNIDVKRFKGTLMCLSAGGNISLDDVQGSVRVKTRGGHVRADRMDGSLQAETGGGSISARFISLSDGLYLQTNAGDITAEIPSGTGLDVVMKGSRTVLDNAPGFRGSRKDNEIDGIIQGGGTTVNMFTRFGKAEIIFIRNTP
jgi:hypothetical protein